jgi:hypothetical protein
MSLLGGKPVIAFERSVKGVIEGEIHHNKCCNCPGSFFICGDRYCCEICGEDHCSSCYVHHNPAHPLTLFRVAEPYTDTDLWTVTDAALRKKTTYYHTFIRINHTFFRMFYTIILD